MLHQKTIPCGIISFGRLPFYASGCTRTNGISITDTDFVPNNRGPASDQQWLKGKTGNGMIVPIGCPRSHGIVFLWCKTFGILSGPDCSCIQIHVLSKKFPPKVFFLTENLAQKFPGLKKIRPIREKPGKVSCILHFIDGAQEPLPVSARPIEPGTLALKCRQSKIFRPEIFRAEKNSV